MTALLTPPRPVSAPPVIRLTEEEFLARYAGQNVELIDGIVKEYPMPGLDHGYVCLNIAGYLWTHVREADIGRVMSNDSWVRIRVGTFRGGDVLYVSWQRLPKGEAVPEGVHDLAPELVVEVKSPTDRWIDLYHKVGEYLTAGVVVVVDPEMRTVTAYRPPIEQTIFEEADALILPDLLPGFSVPVARLFA